VVTIPIKTEDMPHITDSATLQLRDPLSQRVYQARTLHKSNQTQVLGGRSVSFVQALLHPQQPGERITLGTSAQCTIHCGALNPRRYLQRVLRFKIEP
jgi:hypothetical protein